MIHLNFNLELHIKKACFFGNYQVILKILKSVPKSRFIYKHYAYPCAGIHKSLYGEKKERKRQGEF